MKITVKYFGMIAEAKGKNVDVFYDISDTDALWSAIKKDFPELNRFQFAVALNKKMTTGNIKLNDGDEIALLPPYAGG